MVNVIHCIHIVIPSLPQVGPVHCAVQAHAKSLLTLEHLAPLLQGDESHGFTCCENNILMFKLYEMILKFGRNWDV